MTMTINAVINQTGTVCLFDNNNKEIATYVPRKGEHAMEFLEFLEECIPVSKCDEINVTLPGTMPAVYRALDTISLASKFGIRLTTYIYDLNKVQKNFNQLAIQHDQPVECEVRNIL